MREYCTHNYAGHCFLCNKVTFIIILVFIKYPYAWQVSLPFFQEPMHPICIFILLWGKQPIRNSIRAQLYHLEIWHKWVENRSHDIERQAWNKVLLLQFAEFLLGVSYNNLAPMIMNDNEYILRGNPKPSVKFIYNLNDLLYKICNTNILAKLFDIRSQHWI